MIMEGSLVRSSERCGSKDLLGLGEEMEIGEAGGWAGERQKGMLIVNGSGDLFRENTVGLEVRRVGWESVGSGRGAGRDVMRNSALEDWKGDS